MQQKEITKQEIIPSNHVVESNHIISEVEKTTSEVVETTVTPMAEEMSKLLLEDAEAKAQAIENGNGSASSSANASKSSSLIKQKLKYDGMYADGKFLTRGKTRENSIYYINKENNNYREKKNGNLLTIH